MGARQRRQPETLEREQRVVPGQGDGDADQAADIAQAAEHSIYRRQAE